MVQEVKRVKTIRLDNFKIPEKMYKIKADELRKAEKEISEDYNIDKDFVEAKSLATVAYIVLTEAWKIATENAEITKSKHP